MNTVAAMLTGTGLGCLAMYSLDPEMGRRRRAQARDKVVSLQKKVGASAATTARDLRNRTLGTAAEGRSLLLDRKVQAVDDERLADRVRSNLRFLLRYPSFIDTQVNSGRVVLSGAAFADEVEQLIDGVLRIRGVRKVENRLNVYEKAENFPGLQGELRPRPEGRRIDLFQHHWSPSTKLVVGLISAALVGLGALAFGRPTGNRRRMPAAAKLAGAARRGEKLFRSLRR